MRRGVLWALLLVGASGAVGLWLGSHPESLSRLGAGHGGHTPSPVGGVRTPQLRAADRQPAAARPDARPPHDLAPARARAAIIIDDLGHSREALDRLRGLAADLSYSFLPDAPQTPQLAADVAAAGGCVLLHLPMEPEGSHPLEPHTVTVGMSPQAIRRTFEAALARVPGAVGVNNHMGSRATSDPATMGAVIAAVADAGLFFVDSRTTPDSVVAAVAAGHGVLSVGRDVFLDAAGGPGVSAQLDELTRMALQQGQAVAIGHPRESTIAGLKEGLSRVRAKGVAVVPVTELL